MTSRGPSLWRIRFRSPDQEAWNLYPVTFETRAQATEAGHVKFLGTTTVWHVVPSDGDEPASCRDAVPLRDIDDGWGAGLGPPRRLRRRRTQPANPPI